MIRSQTGSAMIYIFIAVALFAAVTYAVTRDSRVGTATMSAEQAAIAASEIIEYGASLAQAASKLVLRGVDETAISFEDSLTTGYVNAGCTTDSCKIFASGGGAVGVLEPASNWLDTTFSANGYYGALFFDGTICVDDLSSGDYTACLSDGIDNEELVFILPFIKKDICTKINDKLGITNPGDDAPEDVGCSWDTEFQGTYADDNAIGDAGSNLQARTAGCYKQASGCGTNGGSYNFYQVLLAR